MTLWCEAALATVMTAGPVIVVPDPAESTAGVRIAGRAEGILLGGNVTVLASTAGTRHKPDMTGKILLIEQ